MTNDPVKGDRLGLRDIILAASAGFVFLIVYLVWSAGGLDPSLWNEATAAAGLRAPRSVLPGYWRLIATPLFEGGGIASAAKTLKILGAVIGAISVGFVYLIIRQAMAFLVRYRDPARWMKRGAYFAFIATVCFGAGEHMWRMVEPLTPGGIDFFLVISCVLLAFRWYVKGRGVRLFPLMFLCGLTAADTAIGFVLPVLIYVGYRLVYNARMNGELFEDDDDELPDAFYLPKWRMFFTFVAGFIIGYWVNSATFESAGGLGANGISAGFMAMVNYAMTYARIVVSSVSPIALVLSLALTALPFVVVLVMFPRLADDGEPLPFGFGLLLMFTALIALVQTGLVSTSRFFELAGGAGMVRSDVIASLLALMNALTIAMACALLAMACITIYDLNTQEGTFSIAGERGIAMRALVPVVVALMTVPALMRIPHPVTGEMRAVVEKGLAETVHELGDAKYVFTDGRLDAGLELAAKAAGRTVYPLDMMSSDSAYDGYLRTRAFHGAADTNDLASVRTGVPVLFRVWAGEKEGGMDTSGIQVGLDFWKRSRKPMPLASGFVAREKGMSVGEAEAGIARTRIIADEVIAVSKKRPEAAASAQLKDALSSISWRISRFARMRDDEELADMLDEWNETVKRMMRLVEYERMRTFMQLTPYEGMRLALRRADFAEARRYAMTVLQMDSNDAEANFGTGMAYLMEEKLKDAEFYLDRCLKSRPDEPAVMNNLSIIYRKTGRLDKAKEYVAKAHELMPDNEEIARTLRDTERLINEREE